MPLTKLTFTLEKWSWTDECQQAFQRMKDIVIKEVMLSYPDFNKPFEIHTDASQTQLGSVILQDNKPIAFYSRKLNPAQTRYTTTEKELLSIVETLKEFRTILLGQQIIVHTDHENLTYKNFNSDRVMRWRLYIEEYSPDLRYVKGVSNVVADSLSRIDIMPPSLNEKTIEEINFNCFAKNKAKGKEEPEDFYPLSYKLLAQAQSKDREAKQKVMSQAKNFMLKKFVAANRPFDLICYKEKIYVPKSMQQKVVDWYHTYLGHPGVNRTEESIAQHLWWPKMRDHITSTVSTCPSCQKNKKRQKKYGHLPEKEAEATPWDKLCVDLIGPYTINRKGASTLICKCVTMIDPATGWFEIHQYDDK